MANWTTCGQDIIEGDVIRWTEAVWKPTRRKKAKPVKIGTRKLVGQVVKADAEWLTVTLKRCEVEPAVGWWRTIPLLKGEARRKRASIARTAERLLWSDESAREAVTRPDNAPRL